MRAGLASWATVLAVAILIPGAANAQTAKQPKIAPGPMEPDWDVVLRDRYGLRVFEDLANPVETDPLAAPGRFRKAGPGPVVFSPEIALGTESRTSGGWYTAPEGAESPERFALWSYVAKNTTKDLETGENLPPKVEEGSKTAFDPGDEPFGVWVSNASFDNEFVYSEPRWVKALTPRLAGQPYKLMIYPTRDAKTGQFVPNSYILGWEYSTNDDFQDVVCRIDNVVLIKD